MDFIRQHLEVIIGVIVVGVLVVFGLSFVFGGGQAEMVTISGEIDFNGLTPQEEGGEGQIVLKQRKHGTEEAYADTGVKVDFVDQTQWSWTQAESGTSYDMMATLIVGGEEIVDSNMVTVTAPATGVVLRLFVTFDDLPEFVLDEARVPVGGELTVSGYIPSGSTITIFGRLQGSEDEFTVVEQGIAALRSQEWVSDQGLPGVHYEGKAVMYSSTGTEIGSSDLVRTVAPSDDTNFRVFSEAQAPAPQPASLSGTVVLNGPVSGNSQVVVQQKAPNESTYTDIATIAAVSGTAWKWDEAVTGATYEVRAILITNGAQAAQSVTSKMVAPHEGSVLTINTGVNLTPPDKKPELRSCTQTSDTKYDAVLLYRTFDNQKGWWIQMGESWGSGNRHDTHRGQNDNDGATLQIDVNAGQTYYTRYAQSKCDNCDGRSNYSDWSPTLEFKCGDKPS